MSTNLLYHISKESKNSFLGQSKYKNRKGFRTCAWRAALCAASHKINGRRKAPPMKWLPKNRNVWFWCIYTTPLKLILSEIPEKSNARRPVGGGQENPSARRQKISSPKTPPFFARSFLEFKITENYLEFYSEVQHRRFQILTFFQFFS